MFAQIVPASRIRALGGNASSSKTSKAAKGFVLYWMVGARRATYNFALQYALEQAAAQGLGVFVLEALRADYPWASQRFHRFVMEGMRDNAEAFADTKVEYYAYVEPASGKGKDLVASLAKEATLVVTDDTPGFFQKEMIEKVAPRLGPPCVAIDSNGLYPIWDSERVFTTAASFRRHLQKELLPHLSHLPLPAPLLDRGPSVAPQLSSGLRKTLASRWPALDMDEKSWGTIFESPNLAKSHEVIRFKGGSCEARRRWKEFLQDTLSEYPEKRNQPEAACQSYLSPYLHFGQIGSCELFVDLMQKEGWSPLSLPEKATGSRSGWWGASEAAEAFLDQFITWRELGFNAAMHDSEFGRFESLPEWARISLAAHENDPRPHLYDLETLAAAKTHDPLWNAAQRQLVDEGIIHNYLRMLWGKKILQWSPSPRRALEVLIELNNRYALDGRDPNSYSGIFWTLGRYDRAWGPEREIFGKIRYMTSESAARKFRVKGYLARYGSDTQLELLQ